MLQLSRADARRIAVQAQLLAAPRPTDLMDVLAQLTMLQNDPTSAVALSADLVLWSRLGTAYAREDLVDALDTCEAVELRGMIRPAADVALYRAEMAEWPGRGDVAGWRLAQQAWVQANDAFRRDILDRLRSDGPLTSRELPDTADVPWRSSGWNNNRNLAMMLDLMVVRGEVSTAGRRGRDKLWDLASRIYPDDPVPAADEARRLRDERRLRALGIARSRCAETPVEPMHVGDAGEPAVIADVPGTWRVDSSLLDKPFRGRAALLSPFDRLVHDRRRTVEIFEFDYQVEMFKPVAKRRWGYFALPILYGDRLVGKLDATADRKQGVLRVDAVHRDVPFGKTLAASVDREIAALAEWLGLGLLLPG